MTLSYIILYNINHNELYIIMMLLYKTSDMEDKEDHLYPPNCTTFVLLTKLMMKALLIVLGIGMYYD